MLDGAYLSSSLGLLRASGVVGKILLPTMDGHLFYFVTVQLVDVVCLTDELDESGHRRRHFGDEYHCLEVFWKNTF